MEGWVTGNNKVLPLTLAPIPSATSNHFYNAKKPGVKAIYSKDSRCAKISAPSSILVLLNWFVVACTIKTGCFTLKSKLHTVTLNEFSLYLNGSCHSCPNALLVHWTGSALGGLFSSPNQDHIDIPSCMILKPRKVLSWCFLAQTLPTPSIQSTTQHSIQSPTSGKLLHYSPSTILMTSMMNNLVTTSFLSETTIILDVTLEFRRLLLNAQLKSSQPASCYCKTYSKWLQQHCCSRIIARWSKYHQLIVALYSVQYSSDWVHSSCMFKFKIQIQRGWVQIQR